MCDIFFDPKLNGGKELVLNISRLLSKVSLDMLCAEQIVKSGHISSFMSAMTGVHRDSSAILIRLAYILGNLTTNFEQARQELTTEREQALISLTELACYYMEREQTPEAVSGGTVRPNPTQGGKVSKYEEFTSGGLEDALTKVIKLLANLSTEEESASRDLEIMSNSGRLGTFLASLMAAVSRRSVSKSDEFILTAISCTTNLLFYDTGSSKLLSEEARLAIFSTCKPHLLTTQNEEL